MIGNYFDLFTSDYIQYDPFGIWYHNDVDLHDVFAWVL